jgi:hypothetical protein
LHSVCCGKIQGGWSWCLSTLPRSLVFGGCCWKPDRLQMQQGNKKRSLFHVSIFCVSLLESTLYLSVTCKHKSPCTHARMRANAHGKIHIYTHRDTQDLLGDLVLNVLLENTTTKLVGNVLIVQQALTSQAQRRPRRVRAWRAPLENTAGNAGWKRSQRAVNALPIRSVLQQVQTF